MNLFIKHGKSHGKTYISIVESYREKGKVKQRTINSLGYEEGLKKKHPDLEKFLDEELEKVKNSEDK